MGALTGYLALDSTDGTAGLCLQTLAGFGAAVKRADPEKNTPLFRELVKEADFLIETGAPGRLDYQELAKNNPKLIMVSITPFGQSGPYRDLKASDLTLQALGGWLAVTGEANRPLRLYGPQAYNTAALFAVNGALLALHRRHETGRGQHIDISVLECAAATLDHVLVRYFYTGEVSGRRGARHWNNAFDILPCADGYILISIHRQWETLVELMAAEGLAEDLTDVKWRERETRNRGIEHIINVLGRWTRRHQAAELEGLGQLMHFPWAAVKNGAEK